MKGILIYSGGMDSTTLLYNYIARIGSAVSFNYGSNHNDKEIECAKWHTKKLKIPHKIIKLDFIKKHFQSSLLAGAEQIPDGHYENKNMKSTVVPFRNGIMLSIAIGLAESEGLDAVFIANHTGDHSVYPDCRESFINQMNFAAILGTYKQIEVSSPYNRISKREIALIGKKMKIDYSKTWSCYKGREYHYGQCGTCIERKEALKGFDKTIYEEGR